jgi:murein DD-endopeptidase MepM/ murein hydrolase activator NlpD
MIIGFRVLAVISALSLVISPLSSQAWFFHTADAQSQTASATNPGQLALADTNSQQIALLSSTVSMTSDLQPNDPDSDIAIADDGTALVPEIGDAGTLEDIIDNPTGGEITTYVVQPGDSVTSIAARFGVTEQTIRLANDLAKTDVVHPGDTLLILPITGVRYIVKAHDTISKIESAYKLSGQDVQTFLDYNNLEQTDPLTIGQVLLIPGTIIEETPSATPAKTTSKTPKPVNQSLIPRGSEHVNINLFTPSGNTDDIVRNYFIKPIPCPLTQGRHDIYAVDISCGVSGTPIHAAADGTVVFAKYGYNGGYGNLVILHHPNGMTTFYAHMENGSITVAQGQSVKQGQVIGHVGSTGITTGPHVHFEVRGGGNPGFDPSGSAWKKWTY